ncbi:hypothetical protein NGM10_05615 [Halorussus salilacus]|uniref:hypothetical protein n=1 Tax=Halorussus salilacus TaxID=2953750 RepID=UPI00209D80A9|nr:hypothetical protein [Halorussus salilacus]USZ69217.1 hypothetical protein NGM10_05615 [Halorussus salilacus]
MSHDIPTSLESEYEPAHNETDKQVVVGSSSCYISDDPVCNSPGDDYEKRF